MKNKVVIDTNVFINSLFRDYDACNKILELAVKNKVKLLFSQDTIGELMYITKKYAIKNMSSDIPRIKALSLIAELFYRANSVDTSNTICPEINDKYDEMFVKCAIEGNADYLITDDFRSGMHNLEGYKFKVISSEDFVKLK